MDQTTLNSILNADIKKLIGELTIENMSLRIALASLQEGLKKTEEKSKEN